jgi:hypothetical protein
VLPASGLPSERQALADFRGADGGVRLDRKLCYDLANIPVPVHHLPNGKTISQQLAAVKRRAGIDRSSGIVAEMQCTGRRALRQSIGKLGQKDGDPVLQPRFTRCCGHSLAHPLASPLDDQVSVGEDEFAQHLFGHLSSILRGRN